MTHDSKERETLKRLILLLLIYDIDSRKLIEEVTGLESYSFSFNSYCLSSTDKQQVFCPSPPPEDNPADPLCRHDDATTLARRFLNQVSTGPLTMVWIFSEAMAVQLPFASS